MPFGPYVAATPAFRAARRSKRSMWTQPKAQMAAKANEPHIIIDLQHKAVLRETELAAPIDIVE